MARFGIRDVQSAYCATLYACCMYMQTCRATYDVAGDDGLDSPISFLSLLGPVRHERNAEGVRFREDCAALVVEVTTRGGEGNKFAQFTAEQNKAQIAMMTGRELRFGSCDGRWLTERLRPGDATADERRAGRWRMCKGRPS